MTQEPADLGRLYVPLRDAACGVSLRLFRDRDGSRCAVGFTSPDRLTAVLGSEQRYYRLTEHAVRALARERSVTALLVDPGLVAPPVREHAETVPVPAPEHSPRRVAAARFAWDAQAAGVLAVSALTGAATLAMQVFK